MKNPKFDFRYTRADDLALLREVAAGDRRMRTGIAGLLRRRLVEADGLHDVWVTPRGHHTLAGLFVGTHFIIGPTYHLPHMHRAIGYITGIFERQVDADGVDEYGYTIKRTKPSVTVEALLEAFTGTWCFYDAPRDLDPIYPTGQPIGGYFAR